MNTQQIYPDNSVDLNLGTDPWCAVYVVDEVDYPFISSFISSLYDGGLITTHQL